MKCENIWYALEGKKIDGHRIEIIGRIATKSALTCKGIKTIRYDAFAKRVSRLKEKMK